MIRECPGRFELLRQFGREGFDAKRFRGVMAAVEYVHAQILGQRIGPVRPFSGNKRVHPFGSGLLQAVAVAGAARHHADIFTIFPPARNQQWLGAERVMQADRQFRSRNFLARSETD